MKAYEGDMPLANAFGSETCCTTVSSWQQNILFFA